MRLIWFALAGGFIVGLAALGLLARIAAVPPGVATQQAAWIPMVEPPNALATGPIRTHPEPAEATGSPEHTHDELTRPSTRRRGYWRRRPSRYPGPVPTPADWKPPEGPVRIGLQAGHWRADEAPPELSGLRRNGTRAGGMAEWEANLRIVQRTASLLQEMGYEVDILPAVVPASYRAHLFVSIHADGSADPGASGFRVAAPRRDATGRASQVVALLAQSYAEATGLKRLPASTRRMRNYYAFNFHRYEHALHPMTIGVIIETGFLTSPTDRRVIVEDPERAARGIVEAVAAFPVTPPPTVAAPPASGGGASDVASRNDGKKTTAERRGKDDG